MAAGAFDREKRWELDAAGSMTSWLRGFAGRSYVDAPKVRATARRLHDLPVTSTAWMEGGLSTAQVGAITANLKAEPSTCSRRARDSWCPRSQAAASATRPRRCTSGRDMRT